MIEISLALKERVKPGQYMTVFTHVGEYEGYLKEFLDGGLVMEWTQSLPAFRDGRIEEQLTKECHYIRWEDIISFKWYEQ